MPFLPKRFPLTLFLLVATLTAITTVVTSQPPGPGGPGRGPGPGGMGPMGPEQMPSILLLQTKEAQQELHLNDEQRKETETQLSKLQEELMSGVDFFAMFQMNEEERQNMFQELRKRGQELSAKTETKIHKLLEEKQIKRLKQLQVQRQGITAFNQKTVTEALELTQKQREEIQKTAEANRPEFGFGPPDFGRMERQRNKALDSAVALLNEAQKTKWSELAGKPFDFPQEQRGFGGPPGGMFGGGPMGGQQTGLLTKFDKKNKGWLNAEERQAALASLKDNPQGGRRGFGGPGGGRRGGGRRGMRGPGGRGGPGGPPGGGPGRGRGREPATPGVQVTPEEVASYPEAKMFEPTVLRTFFLEFENENWETELQSFKGTDIEVPATLTVDGKTYPQVGIHFRGMSSFMMIQAGHKRSINLSLDFVNKEQRLYGYKTLNLLNCNGDSSFMSTALYSHIARKLTPAPKANFVKVVINGENWGVYANVQQFNKVFAAENYGTSKGTRWKVRGNPGGDAGLRYLGEDLEEYKSRYQMKSNDGEAEWQALVDLCRILNETPSEELEEKLASILDIEGALKFIALDVALINSDGYWTRASDYTIFREESGMFHVIPHDMNEAFQEGGHGPGRRQNANAKPFELDPLTSIDNDRFALRTRLLAVPKLRAKYLEYIKQIAGESLDWNQLGPIVDQYHELIKEEVKADTKKLSSFEAFEKAAANTDEAGEPNESSLHEFAKKRAEFLLNYKQ